MRRTNANASDVHKQSRNARTECQCGSNQTNQTNQTHRYGVTYRILVSELISQLQLKASLSLHCVPNRGLPFLVEMIVMKTARHEGRCMMNHFAKR